MADCGHPHRVRNGMVRGKQRFKCKSCGLSFTEHDLHDQYPDSFRNLAQFLRAERVSALAIAEIIGVSPETVRRWTRDVSTTSGTLAHEYEGDIHKDEKEERRAVGPLRIFLRFRAFNITVRPNLNQDTDDS